jgi:hypothetical protein
MAKSGWIEDPARKTPVTKEVDVLVGGGMAGAGAAIAAGRMGASTLLVEYFGCLGGNATNGLVNKFCGYITSGPEKFQVVKGIGGDVIQALIDRGGASSVSNAVFNPEILKRVLDQMMIDSGAQLLYYTHMLEPIVDQGAVVGVVVHNKSGRQAILAKRVIDCTGDGDVCAAAGVPFELGDGQGTFQQTDLCFHVVNASPDFDPSTVTPTAAAAIEAGEATRYGITRAACITQNIMIPGAYWFNWNGIGFPVNGVDPEHLTQAAIRGRQSSVGLMRFLRERVAGMEHADIIETAAKIGIRETRRMCGEYTLTGEAVLAGKKFDDGIGACAWPIERVTVTGRTFVYLKGDDFYTIPYRCLVPQGVENLLMAGRFISASHEAQASVRVMGPAVVMGHAAGTAAVLSIKEKVFPRKLNIGILRRELQAAGAFLG